MDTGDNRIWTYDPSIYSRTQVSSSSRLTDTQRSTSSINQSSGVTHLPSHLQTQQPPAAKIRHWYPRRCDIKSPSTKDVQFFRNTLRQNLIYDSIGVYYPPAPGTAAFEQAVQWNIATEQRGVRYFNNSEAMDRHETLMLRTSATSGLSQSQSFNRSVCSYSNTSQRTSEYCGYCI